MESSIPAVVAGAVGLPLGWLAASRQHLLYREKAFRSAPLTGRWALVARCGLALAFGATLALAFRPHHYDPLPAAMTGIATMVLATIASTDFERKRIPNRLVYPSLLAACVASMFWPDRDLLDIVAGGGIALAVALFMVALGALLGGAVGAGQTAFGVGDAKLILLIGLLLGLPRVLGALFIGVLAGGLPAVALLALGRRRSAYSYGPYLALGGTVFLLWPELY